MPTDVKKVSEEQLKELQQLQTQYTNALFRIGEITLQQDILAAELDEVKQFVDRLGTRRIGIVDKLQKEFGSTGTIDLSTGEFVAD